MENTKSELAAKECAQQDLRRAGRQWPSHRIFGAAVAFVALGVCTIGNAGSGAAQTQGREVSAPTTDNDGAVHVDKDGTVHLPAMAVPVSEYLSPEAQAWVAEYLRVSQSPEWQDQVDGTPKYMQRFVDRDRQLYPVTQKDTTIGGVHVYDFMPTGGVSQRNKKRVLIQLHAGGFAGCFSVCSELQSMPISSLGHIRVVGVDFREAPKYKFPAASEDVAAVYRELLKTYPAKNIGIFGCSAGGELTGQSVAWFQTHGLPAPGAIGIYCAGEALSPRGIGMGGGDSSYIGHAIADGIAPRAGRTPRRDGYMTNADLNDPMASPVASDQVLSKFPPTQIITGTRFWDESTAVYTHSRLVKVGVDADLHVWEGLFHFFFMNPDVPESRDAYNVTTKFFDKHLGH